MTYRVEGLSGIGSPLSVSSALYIEQCARSVEGLSRALISLLIDALEYGTLGRMTAITSAGRTARERARAELTREIKQEARRQLAAHGAQGLSLRAVARELGMVSSALYRYFPSRDELLTALIIDAYDALGEAAEAASAGRPAADLPERVVGVDDERGQQL